MIHAAPWAGKKKNWYMFITENRKHTKKEKNYPWPHFTIGLEFQVPGRGVEGMLLPLVWNHLFCYLNANIHLGFLGVFCFCFCFLIFNLFFTFIYFLIFLFVGFLLCLINVKHLLLQIPSNFIPCLEIVCFKILLSFFSSFSMIKNVEYLGYGKEYYNEDWSAFIFWN